MEQYKCFDKGLINRYGIKFEIDKIYQVFGNIKFGVNGFHTCSNFEDTLRYFDSKNELDITIVDGFGNFSKCDDEYYGFYDMYAWEKMIIKRVLSREEIIDKAIKLDEFRLKRFISLFKMSDEEKNLFISMYKNDVDIFNYIEYYQNNIIDVFKRKVLK